MPHALFSQEFQRRLAEYADGLQAGTVSPAVRYRLEGFAEAGVALGLATAEDVQVQVDRLLAFAGAAARPDSDVPICLPFRLPVAPVYASTR